MISVKSPEKPKRGRPALELPEVLSMVAQQFGPELAGRKDRPRQLRLLAARQRGLRLALEHGLTWIADKDQIAVGGRAALSVCAELGLLLRAGWSEADVLELAHLVGEQGPSITVAVARLRSVRREQREASSGDWPMLARALERTLNGYLARHPAFSWGDALRALSFVTTECQDAEAEASR